MVKKRKDNRLPKYVYRTKTAYVWVEYRGRGEKRQSIKLCDADAPISHIWECYEREVANDVSGTLQWLLANYIASPQFADKADSTQAEQRRQSSKICAYPRGRGQVFGSAPLSAITPGVIQKYLDARAEDGAPKSGNREMALISAAWSWARARDLTTVPNPCTVVKRNKETARQHYASDDDYNKWIEYLKTSKAPEYLWIVSEIAYICLMRKSEVLTALKTQVLDEGFDTLRKKGSRDAITSWSPRLQDAVASAQKNPRVRFSQYLVTRGDGSPVSISGFNSAWQRHMKIAVETLGITRFTTHDLKHKGATDSDQDATVSTGNTPARPKCTTSKN